VIARTAPPLQGMAEESASPSPKRSAKEPRACSPTWATTPVPPGSTMTRRVLLPFTLEVSFCWGPRVSRQPQFPLLEGHFRGRASVSSNGGVKSWGSAPEPGALEGTAQMLRRLTTMVLIVLVAGSVAACSRTTNNGQSAFGSDLSAVGAEQQSVGADAIAGSSSGNFTAFGTDCHQLLADVGKLQGDTIPSNYTSAMQTELINIESDLTEGANACIQAVNNNDQNSLNTAVNLFSAAGALERQLTSQGG